MRKIYYSFIFALLYLVCNCQDALSQEFIPIKYWVSFTDKQGTPFSIAEPEAFLSQRSIQRRVSQGIAITQEDLPVNPDYIQALFEDPLVEVLYSSRWLNGALIRAGETESVQRILDLPFVVQVTYVKPLTPDERINVSGVQVMEYEETLSQKHWDSSSSKWELLYSGLDYGLGRRQVEQVNGHILHQAGFVGSGKMIAVLDAGFTNVDQLPGMAHLWDHGQITGFRDFVEPEADFWDTHNHGTVVLSVMGVNRPGEVMGTALGADYYLIRTEDHRSEFIIEEYNWLAGAELADSIGADIINSSLGYSTFDDPSQNHTYQDLDGNTTVVARAANMAHERGILVVSSAGNYGASQWRYVGTPADSFGAFSIGAVDSLGLRVSFSSVGPTADGRIKPEVMAMGRHVVVENTNGQLGMASGTSFSSPIIAGMAACLWEKHPGSSAAQIRRAIIESSHMFLSPDYLMGHGIPNFALADRILRFNFEIREDPLVLFPNPFNQNSILSFYSQSEQQAVLQVFDTTGRLLHSLGNIALTAGNNELYPFRDMPTPAQGIYLIRLSPSNQESPQVLKAIRAW